MRDKSKIKFIVKEIVGNAQFLDTGYYALSTTVIASIYKKVTGKYLIGGIYSVAFPAIHAYINKYQDAFSIFGITIYFNKDNNLADIYYRGYPIRFRS